MKQFRFTVFGLGNTQYEHYNKMGRLTNKILNDVGAKRYSSIIIIKVFINMEKAMTINPWRKISINGS